MYVLDVERQSRWAGDKEQSKPMEELARQKDHTEQAAKNDSVGKVSKIKTELTNIRTHHKNNRQYCLVTSKLDGRLLAISKDFLQLLSKCVWIKWESSAEEPVTCRKKSCGKLTNDVQQHSFSPV